MQIVISISDSFYDRLKDMDIDNDTCSFNESALVDSIQNGTPLEQEPCEDAISRQAVLDEMYKRKADNDAITPGFIKNLPPVTPHPKSAHWILYRDHKNMIDYPQCDNCDVIIKLPLPIDNLNFCPNCGRKMEVDE